MTPSPTLSRSPLVLAITCWVVIGAAESTAPQEARKSDVVRPPPAELPEPRLRTLPAPEPDQSAMLDQLLERLRDPDPINRQVALGEVSNVDESLLPAIQARLDHEAERADRQRMKQLLLDIRREARDAIEKRMRAAGERGEIETPDYLEMAVAHPDTSAEVWPSLVNVLALSRMCVHMKTVESVRVLITVYVRFDFLRIDTQLQIGELGDHALAALIEATRHPAPKIASWASRQLDTLGKAIPGEAVQVDAPEVLADVLRAYGRIKDPDAARVVLSFCNSERSQIREAAREAVVSFGEVANWQLRDVYENMLGKRPPREWSWERTARELFTELDAMRLEEVYAHYRTGLDALRAEDFKAMASAFDRVLRKSPEFRPRDKLVAGYLAFAESEFDDPRGEVDQALGRVQRLAVDEQTKARATSLLLTRRARVHSEQGLADRSLLARALELDPQNQRARSLLDELSREPITERTSFARVAWPSVLVAVALAAVVAILLRQRRSDGSG